MYRFWEPIIAPIIKSIQPQAIVEIGSDYGHNTSKLISYCQNNRAQLYVIDPLPKYDFAQWKERYGSLFHFYQSLSLNALPLIGKMDVVLIDGDHNWYTVINELRMLEKSACKNDSLFPLVFLHDISWPYGRRDLYYNPEAIPVAYRKPFKKMGLLPGKKELVENEGINSHLDNAIHENIFQSGVLTAVEDFLQETSLDLKFHAIPVFHGLGILYPKELSSIHPECDQFLVNLHCSQEQDVLLAMVEDEFLNSKIVNRQKRRKLESQLVNQQKLNIKLNEDLERMRNQYAAKRRDYGKLKEQQEETVKLLTEHKHQLGELRNHEVATRDELSRNQEATAQISGEYKKLESDLTKQQEINTKLHEDLERMRNQYAARQSNLETLREEIQGKKELLKERKKRLMEASEDRAQLNREVESLKISLAKLNDERERINRKIEGIACEEASLIQLLEAAYEENRSLRSALDDALEMI